MTTPVGRGRHDVERELPPIRWPHPGRVFIALIGVWLLGLMLAVFVPALIVPPGDPTAPTGQVLLAFACTLAGALVMTGVGLVFWRRHEDPVATVFGVVPAIAVVAGGVVMMATKLTGV
ncbi:MAG: hypothetical protein ACOYXW_18325 [Actinomycetota bacterium]